MAQMLEVTCGQCGEQEIQLDGPVLAGARSRCEQCGDTRLVPWPRLTGDVDPDGHADDTAATCAADEASTCSCSGRFSAEAPIRCSVCRSTDVSTTFFGVAD